MHSPDHRFAVVVEESVLRYQLGSSDIMAGQLGHLLSILAVPSVSLGVIPFSAASRLAALSRVPPGVFAYLNAHGAAVSKAAADTAGQWKTWYSICFGGIVFFLLSIPLLRGRSRPRNARRDEAEHEAMVQAELAKLGVTADTG